MKRANTTLIFLGSCLAFAETALAAIAGLTDVNPTLIAVFALLALIVVVGALVIMYWRDPAFLTLSGEQAHDLRRLEILTRATPGQVWPMYGTDLGAVPATLDGEVIGTDIGESVQSELEEID